MKEEERKARASAMEREKQMAKRYESGKSSFRASDGFGPRSGSLTPEQQRMKNMREAEQNRRKGDAKGIREASARAANRKSVDRLKPPAAPMPPSTTARQSAIQRLLKGLKGGKGLGALGLVGAALEGGKAATMKKPKARQE